MIVAGKPYSPWKSPLSACKATSQSPSEMLGHWICMGDWLDELILFIRPCFQSDHVIPIDHHLTTIKDKRPKVLRLSFRNFKHQYQEVFLVYYTGCGRCWRQSLVIRLGRPNASTSSAASPGGWWGGAHFAPIFQISGSHWVYFWYITVCIFFCFSKVIDDYQTEIMF